MKTKDILNEYLQLLYFDKWKIKRCPELSGKNNQKSFFLHKYKFLTRLLFPLLLVKTT